MKKLYCLYMHISPEGLRYIGKTSRKPVKRWTEGTRYTKNQDFFDVITQYGEHNFLSVFEHYYLDIDKETWLPWQLDISYLETNVFSCYEAEELEKHWIEKFDTMNPTRGFNRSSGGDSSFRYHEIAKDRNRQAHIGLYDGENNPFFGKTHSPETKKNLSAHAQHRTGDKNPFYGKHHSKESMEKNRQSHLGLYEGEKNPFYGKSHSAETKRRIGEKTRKPVDQFDLSGQFIRQYSSVFEAAEAVGRSISTLSANCVRNQGEKLHHCAGYVFRFSKVEK